MKAAILFCCLAWVGVSAWAADGQILEATTSDGQKVRLLPNGRWEFVDAAKQAVAKKVADTYPENRSSDAQGRLFGIGRSIEPGDKDYNRGSLNPKMR
ncbi:MAG: hypothetical protein KF778_15270 [Rhodocyclaceae bacterium]|nr:hypothetical protein [Rhodocyclaceae bacterium]MBX3669760.1 hypothetical protein [Rhodocyclaceae bacterium]